MKKLTIIFLIILIFSACTPIKKIENKLSRNKTEKNNEKIIENIQNYKDSNDYAEIDKIEIIETPKTDDKKKVIPEKALIEAEFICQAPLETTQNWTFHEESCEEAALLQTYNYEKNIKMTKEEANIEILNMISWQKNNFNGHHDIYADKIKEMAVNFYNLENQEIKIIYDANIEKIKQIIAEGHPVIAPVTSKYLKNPNYPHPGYHMLQVIGFDDNYIITNDNGTRKGSRYPYKIEDFEKALIDAGADILYLELQKAS